MQRLMHGDYALVQPTEIDRKGRQEARLVRLLKAREADIVGRYFVENGVGFVVPDDSRIGQDIIIPEGRTRARQSQVVVVRINQRATRPLQRGRYRAGSAGRETWRLAWRSRSPQRTHGIPHPGRRR